MVHSLGPQCPPHARDFEAEKIYFFHDNCQNPLGLHALLDSLLDSLPKLGEDIDTVVYFED